MVEHTSSASNPAPEASALPAPDALSPEALREEIINIIMGLGGGAHVARGAAEKKADGVLAKLMLYYMDAATPEVVAEAPQTFALVQEVAHSVDRIVSAGAKLAGPLPEDDPLRKTWAEAAVALRASWARFMTVVT